MIKVRTFTATASKHENGAKFSLDSEKNLLIRDLDGNCIAMYAHGEWASVVVEPKKD